MEAAGKVWGTVGELQVRRHAPGGGGRGHATQRGGAPQRVLPPTGRVEFTGGVLQRYGDQTAKWARKRHIMIKAAVFRSHTSTFWEIPLFSQLQAQNNVCTQHDLIRCHLSSLSIKPGNSLALSERNKTHLPSSPKLSNNYQIKYNALIR